MRVQSKSGRIENKCGDEPYSFATRRSVANPQGSDRVVSDAYERMPPLPQAPPTRSRENHFTAVQHPLQAPTRRAKREMTGRIASMGVITSSVIGHRLERGLEDTSSSNPRNRSNG